MNRRALRLGFALLALLGLAGSLLSQSAAASSGTATPPRNPYLSRGPDATMHGDAETSDTFDVAGPGRAAVTASYHPLAADCPTMLVGSDGLIQAVCVNIAGESPVAYLIDPSTSLPLATMNLTKSGLLGGIYSYLDARDRLVIVDGSDTLFLIAHTRSALGTWSFETSRQIPLAGAIGSGDSVVGLTPAWNGLIWFTSAAGVIGTVNLATGTVRHAHLPAGESVANSISSAPGGVAVATSKALYLYRSSASGAPMRQWRRAYDAGTVRKPGQLSKGTGATPAFFGPRSGAEYVAITDNADAGEHLLVYATSDGSLVCDQRVVRGTENAPIGYGRSVYVASTYGYPYPAYPAGAGDSSPATAPFTGGLTRVDLRPSGSGCDVKWTAPVRSASLPKLSRRDGLIYTTQRTGLQDPSTTSEADRYDFVAISAATGKIVNSALIGYGAEVDPIQQAGALDRTGTYYQGVLTGFVRIARN